MKQQTKPATYNPYPLPYKKAPAGSPDKYVTTETVTYVWRNVRPSLVAHLPVGEISVGDSNNPGKLKHEVFKGQHFLTLEIPAPFYFAVSVAPSFRRALPGALPHDYIYAYSEQIAELLGISEREVLHIADRWFFAQLTASGFFFRRTYFIAVHIFGYWFHQIFGKDHDRRPPSFPTYLKQA